jgi:hypothetical protein
MTAKRGVILGVGVVCLLAAISGPARAESRRPVLRPNRGGGGGGGQRGVQVPVYPDSNMTYPEWLIYQDFQRMRATSPNPNNFLGGKYNPQYRTVYPPTIQVYPPGDGYGYGLYGSFGGPGLYGNFGYGGGGSYVQRDTYIYREGGGQIDPRGGGQVAPRTGTRGAGTGSRTGGEAAPPEERADTGSGSGDFYLKGKGAGESISDALDDLRKAWLNGDFDRLKARFKADGKVRIFPKGEFKYTVPSQEFLDILKDAMTKLDTIAFELNRPTSDAKGRVFVAGKHTYVDDAKAKHETYISYGLDRIDGRWTIVEAGSASDPIAAHKG